MGAEDGFYEMAAEDFVFGADGGEVGAGVPFLEELEVAVELFDQLRGKRGRAGLGEVFVEARGGGHEGIVGD